jgi:integral membrane protein
MAILVGIGLLALLGVAMPLKYLAEDETVIGVVGPVHGLLYMIFLLVTLDLANRGRWPLRRTVGVALAGTVPFLSFVVERRMVRDVHARLTAEEAPV